MICFVVLLLLSGLVFVVHAQNRFQRIEQAANQIPLGSRWHKVWTSDPQLWGNPIQLSSNSVIMDFEYGKLSRQVQSETGSLLSRIGVPITWLYWFCFTDSQSVIISVDNDGKGNVIAVRVQGQWRRAMPGATESTDTK